MTEKRRFLGLTPSKLGGCGQVVIALNEKDIDRVYRVN